MIIYTKAGPLAFHTFTFPDGQPHFKLLTREMEFRDATIETAIRNPNELILTILAIDALRSAGYIVSLDIRYLMGARMDRQMGVGEPFTLLMVARMLQMSGVMTIRVLDPHSQVALGLLGAKAVMPFFAVRSVLATLGDVEIVAPDKGATIRVETLCNTYMNERDYPVIQALKKRNQSTGAIVDIQVENASFVKGRPCLIVDDICDGGATFVALAAALRAAGASKVFLYVTHGIFSKSLPLAGIDMIYTTDSYHDWTQGPMQSRGLTCIPISMKELA